MSPDVAAFRAAVGRFATGVTVLTSVVDGTHHAMTANAFTSVSLDPLLVLFCVDQEARFRDAVLAAGTWGVSILDSSARGAAQWLATQGRPLVGQLDPVPFRPGPVTGAPLLLAALATLECRTRDVHQGGDHDIVVGEVLAVDLQPAGYGPESTPLLWFRGRYHSL